MRYHLSAYGVATVLLCMTAMPMPGLAQSQLLSTSASIATAYSDREDAALKSSMLDLMRHASAMIEKQDRIATEYDLDRLIETAARLQLMPSSQFSEDRIPSSYTGRRVLLVQTTPLAALQPVTLDRLPLTIQTLKRGLARSSIDVSALHDARIGYISYAPLPAESRHIIEEARLAVAKEDWRAAGHAMSTLQLQVIETAMQRIPSRLIARDQLVLARTMLEQHNRDMAENALKQAQLSLYGTTDEAVSARLSTELRSDDEFQQLHADMNDLSQQLTLESTTSPQMFEDSLDRWMTQLTG